jgi:hypothetical protein
MTTQVKGHCYWRREESNEKGQEGNPRSRHGEGRHCIATGRKTGEEDSASNEYAPGHLRERAGDQEETKQREGPLDDPESRNQEDFLFRCLSLFLVPRSQPIPTLVFLSLRFAPPLLNFHLSTLAKPEVTPGYLQRGLEQLGSETYQSSPPAQRSHHREASFMADPVYGTG